MLNELYELMFESLIYGPDMSQPARRALLSKELPGNYPMPLQGMRGHKPIDMDFQGDRIPITLLPHIYSYIPSDPVTVSSKDEFTLKSTGIWTRKYMSVMHDASFGFSVKVTKVQCYLGVRKVMSQYVQISEDGLQVTISKPFNHIVVYFVMKMILLNNQTKFIIIQTKPIQNK